MIGIYTLSMTCVSYGVITIMSTRVGTTAGKEQEWLILENQKYKIILILRKE